MNSIQQTLAALPTQPTATVEHHPLVLAHPWDYQAYHPALQPVLPAVHDFCTAVLTAQSRRWLSLLGPSGIGKTYILTQAFDLLQHAARTGQWKIQTHTGKRGPQIAHLIPGQDLTDYRAPADYGKYDLLYIEDIGAGAFGDKGSGAVIRARLVELLQYRTNRWTLLDANLYRRDIAREIDPRIASRLRRDGSTCLELPTDIPDFWG